MEEKIAAKRLRECLDTVCMDLGLHAETVLQPEEHARTVLDRLIPLMGARRAYIFLYQGETDVLLLAAHGMEPDALIYESPVLHRVLAGHLPVLAVEGEPHARSVMAVPLMVQQRLLGVLWLENDLAARQFQTEDLQVVGALANHVAHSLQAARAARVEVEVVAERGMRRMAEMLRQQSMAIASTLQYEEVLARLLHGLGELVQHDRSETSMAPPAALEPWLQGVLENGEARCSESGNSLAIPLFRELRPMGLVLLQRNSGRFADYEVKLAEAFCVHGSIALENARLFATIEQMATVDLVTGVWNRRKVLEEAEREVIRARRMKSGLSILLLDIDHFKQFNDNYGHTFGDVVLTEVAQRCRRSLRQIDTFGRFGGEEFLAVLPGASFPLERAETVRNAVAQEPMQHATYGPLTVTVSLGLAQFDAETTDLHALLRRADEALYAAKDAGRNCVRVA
ncbi:MAG: GGDEF domain-containing protein [Candidatus Xenobia bacterium]